jgi:hypothetical protein
VLWEGLPLRGAEAHYDDEDREENATVRNAATTRRSILFGSLSETTLKDLGSLAPDLHIDRSMSITEGSVWSGFAAKFLNAEHQDEEGGGDSGGSRTDPRPDLITGPMKDKYLTYLHTLGFAGLWSLLSSEPRR